MKTFKFVRGHDARVLAIESKTYCYPSYNTLVGKVMRLWPDLAITQKGQDTTHVGFRLAYRDGDGDVVTVADDESVVAAITVSANHHRRAIRLDVIETTAGTKDMGPSAAARNASAPHHDYDPWAASWGHWGWQPHRINTTSTSWQRRTSLWSIILGATLHAIGVPWFVLMWGCAMSAMWRASHCDMTAVRPCNVARPRQQCSPCVPHPSRCHGNNARVRAQHRHPFYRILNCACVPRDLDIDPMHVSVNTTNNTVTSASAPTPSPSYTVKSTPTRVSGSPNTATSGPKPVVVDAVRTPATTTVIAANPMSPKPNDVEEEEAEDITPTHRGDYIDNAAVPSADAPVQQKQPFMAAGSDNDSLSDDGVIVDAWGLPSDTPADTASKVQLLLDMGFALSRTDAEAIITTHGGRMDLAVRELIAKQ